MYSKWILTMDERKRKYDKKGEIKNKTQNISLRVTPRIANLIDENAHKAGLSKTDYIIKSCTNSTITPIPFAHEILQTLYQVHTSIETLAHVTDTEQLSNSVTDLVLLLDTNNEIIRKTHAGSFFIEK